MTKFSISRITGIILFIILIAALTISTYAENGKYVVILDPGHGGVDGGTDEGVKTEKEYNFIIAQYLKAELEAHEDFEVYLTRTDDSYIKFLPRAMKIIEHNADILISLHCNSNTATYINGCDAFVSVVDEYNGTTLAGWILDGISSSVPIARGRVQMREDTGDSLGIYYWNAEKKWDMPAAWWLGKKSDYYSMCTWSSKFGVSSIIIEHGYLSNWNDRQVIAEDANLRAMAKAEADAIIRYFTGHEHTYTAEKVVDFPSNCTFAGTKSYRCTFCGAKKDTEALPAAPDAHYYRCTGERAVCCENDGYASYLCQISFNLNDKGYPCTVHEYTTTTPALGHNYVIVENVPATHGSNGIKKSICQNCGDTVTEIITGDAHNYDVTAETLPTCTDAGSRTSLCSVCGYEKTETLDALGHDYAVESEVPVTPEEDGYIYYSCTRCSEKMTETVPRCDHDYLTETTDATCVDTGSIFYSCQKCGYEKTEDIPALGHKHEILEETPPSCTLSGVNHVRCTVCGDEDDIIIQSPGHSFKITKDGLFKTEKTCTVCGEILIVDAENKDSAALAVVGAVAVALALIGLAIFFVIRNRHSTHPTEGDLIVSSDSEEGEGESQEATDTLTHVVIEDSHSDLKGTENGDDIASHVVIEEGVAESEVHHNESDNDATHVVITDESADIHQKASDTDENSEIITI